MRQMYGKQARRPWSDEPSRCYRTVCRADLLRTHRRNNFGTVRQSVPLCEHVVEMLIGSAHWLEAQADFPLGQAALAAEAADIP